MSFFEKDENVHTEEDSNRECGGGFPQCFFFLGHRQFSLFCSAFQMTPSHRLAGPSRKKVEWSRAHGAGMFSSRGFLDLVFVSEIWTVPLVVMYTSLAE